MPSRFSHALTAVARISDRVDRDSSLHALHAYADERHDELAEEDRELAIDRELMIRRIVQSKSCARSA